MKVGVLFVTVVGRVGSVDWTDEGWVARRTYTSIRSPDRSGPC